MVYLDCFCIIRGWNFFILKRNLWSMFWIVRYDMIWWIYWVVLYMKVEIKKIKKIIICRSVLYIVVFLLLFWFYFVNLLEKFRYVFKIVWKKFNVFLMILLFLLIRFVMFLIYVFGCCKVGIFKKISDWCRWWFVLKLLILFGDVVMIKFGLWF